MVTLDQDSYSKKTDIDLSQNEARVLHSLVKWPNLSDQAIHSQIGMKKSTFSSIKTRLKEQGYYQRYFIPNFPKIGFELFMLMHGRLNRFTTYEERMRIAKDTLLSFTEDFHVISEANQAYHLSVSQNYTEYAKNYEKYIQLYSQNNFLSKEGMTVTHFPFQISEIHSFMDYESLIGKLFDFTTDKYNTRSTIPTGKTQKIKLTRAERKVLAGLVKYPEESDTLIAENIGVSRNTVANAKRKFLSKNICFPRVVPNLEKLGLKILNFTYRKFNPKMTQGQKVEAVETVREHLSPHFFITKNMEGFYVSAHISDDEFEDETKFVNNFYAKLGFVMEDPITYRMDISQMNVIKDFDFLPMSLKILGFSSFPKAKS